MLGTTGRVNTATYRFKGDVRFVSVESLDVRWFTVVR
jgi:hypothetical protein